MNPIVHPIAATPAEISHSPTRAGTVPLLFALTTLITAAVLPPALAVAADSVKSKCPDLEKCAHSVAELTGEKYIYDGETPRGLVRATDNFELTKENADEVFTLMLNQSGFTRLPLSEANTFVILRQRDARDSALPILLADAKSIPPFPKTWDLATLRYHLSQPELAESICRQIRSFMPGNSRVVADEISGQIILAAPYPILANALSTIQTLDVKLSPEKLKKLDARAHSAHESEKRAATPNPPAEIPLPPSNGPPHH